MNKNKIITYIRKHRKRGLDMVSCPFMRGTTALCPMCKDIFPTYRGTRKHGCPCDHFSKGYVRRRMKLLFPELYGG